MTPCLTIHDTLCAAKAALAAHSDNPQLEAEVLLAFVLKESRSYLRAWPEKTLTPEQHASFTALLQRRCQREPLSYLTGQREFWSLDLLVTPDTLIPRPETELLVQTALDLMSEKSNSIHVADLGTGSGAIALAIAHERPLWHVDAVDISDNALQVARKNAQRLGIENVSFYRGNWCTALPHSHFDIILSNPPYIAETEWAEYANGLAFEPRNALVSGWDGLDAIRTISQSAKAYLKPHGYLLMEHGFLQGSAVRALLIEAGFNNVHSLLDLSGQERVTVGCMPCASIKGSQ